MNGSVSKLPYYHGQDQYNRVGPWGDATNVGDPSGDGSSLPGSAIATMPQHPILDYLNSFSRNRLLGRQTQFQKPKGGSMCGNAQGAATVGSMAPITPGAA